MRLVTFVDPSGAERVGALDGDAAVDLGAAYAVHLERAGTEPERARQVAGALFGSMVALIEAGETGKQQAELAIEAARAAEGLAHPLDAIRLLAPLRPVALRDCIAFEGHLRHYMEEIRGLQIPAEWYERPVYYKGNAHTVVGPEDDVPWPAYSSQRDYELELGVVVGPGGVDLDPEQAEGHIYGLTIFDDFSARDEQAREMPVGLGPAKSKDFATGLGPWILTIDEVDDVYTLDMRASVNGELWSEGTTGSIHWRFGEIMSRMSQSEPLRAGEVFGSGTVENGCGLEFGRFLEHGDVVELEITGLGVLRNRIVAR